MGPVGARLEKQAGGTMAMESEQFSGLLHELLVRIVQKEVMNSKGN